MTAWAVFLTLAAIFVLALSFALAKVSGESAEAAARASPIPDRADDPEESTLHPLGLETGVTPEEITLAARVVWGEARGIESRMEQAAVVWCMLNRVDETGDRLGEVATAPNQFAYSPTHPTIDDYGRDLEELVRDVVDRWARERAGECAVGRVLPKGYLWFSAWDGRNWFRSSYENLDHPWAWRLPNPYSS